MTGKQIEYETAVLIGGPHDGQRLSVMAGLPVLRMLPKVDAPTIIDRRGAMPTVSTCNLLEYHRQPVQSDKGFKGAVYVFGGVDAMIALIEGYRKP